MATICDANKDDIITAVDTSRLNIFAEPKFVSHQNLDQFWDNAKGVIDAMDTRIQEQLTALANDTKIQMDTIDRKTSDAIWTATHEIREEMKYVTLSAQDIINRCGVLESKLSDIIMRKIWTDSLRSPDVGEVVRVLWCETIERGFIVRDTFDYRLSDASNREIFMFDTYDYIVMNQEISLAAAHKVNLEWVMYDLIYQGADHAKTRTIRDYYVMKTMDVTYGTDTDPKFIDGIANDMELVSILNEYKEQYGVDYNDIVYYRQEELADPKRCFRECMRRIGTFMFVNNYIMADLHLQEPIPDTITSHENLYWKKCYWNNNGWFPIELIGSDADAVTEAEEE